MMRILVQKIIKLIVVAEFFILLFLLISFEAYINMQVAFLSAFIVMIGSSYAYQKMVQQNAVCHHYEESDLLAKIDDPHGLYEEEVEHEPQELTSQKIKEILLDEKKKIKTLSIESLKYGSKATLSLYRIGGYLFLVLAFIALNNNQLLQLAYYLPALLIGIVVGYLVVSSRSLEC